MEAVAHQVEPDQVEILDPAALLDLRDEADRMPRGPRPDGSPLLSKLVGSSIYRTKVVLRGGSPPRVLKLWRVYPYARLGCDRIEKGQEPEAWRGELCRANGLRWMPFTHGEKVTKGELIAKIERAA